MKNLVKLIFVTLIVSMFSSCKKDNLPTPVNTDAIKAQLSAISVPTKQVVQAYLASANLKSVADENPATVLVEIFPLDKSTYEVYGTYAIKPHVYYEMSESHFRNSYLTLKQRFNVRNGIVDTTNYTFTYEVGCSYSRYYRFKSCNYIYQTIFFFRFDNGRQFAYNCNNSDPCSVQLPPISGGKWQISVKYNTDGVYQSFMSQLIDPSVETNYFIDLKFDVKPENTVAIIEIKTSNYDFIKQANYIELVGKDDHGDYVYFDYPFAYDNTMPDIISFPAPFDIERIIIYGPYDGYWSSYTANLQHVMKDGKIIYQLN